MKIRSVTANNRMHVFEVRMGRGVMRFPYSKADPVPSSDDRLVELYVDPELAREGFTYQLASGAEGSVLADQVLEYNENPAYMRGLLLYKLTLEAERCLSASGLSKREVMRRLHTSPAQLYRLLDTTNSRKSVDNMLALLHALGCEVDLVVKG